MIHSLRRRARPRVAAARRAGIFAFALFGDPVEQRRRSCRSGQRRAAGQAVVRVLPYRVG